MLTTCKIIKIHFSFHLNFVETISHNTCHICDNKCWTTGQQTDLKSLYNKKPLEFWCYWRFLHNSGIHIYSQVVTHWSWRNFSSMERESSKTICANENLSKASGIIKNKGDLKNHLKNKVCNFWYTETINLWRCRSRIFLGMKV